MLKRDREQSSRPSRSRSRSPRRNSPPRSRHGSESRGTPRGQDPATHRSWASRMEEEESDYQRPDSDEEIERTLGGPDVREVSEETRRLLTRACSRSVGNETRRRCRGRYPLPKVAVTKSPNLDPFMRTEVSSNVKAGDKELAKIQSFVLDSLAPLTALLEQGQEMSPDEVRDATSTAVELIGNANARISRLRRERIVTSVNKVLLPLARDDEQFAEAAPHLFGTDFARQSKEFMDQVKAIRSTLPSKTKEPARKPFFRGGPPRRGEGTNSGAETPAASGAVAGHRTNCRHSRHSVYTLCRSTCIPKSICTSSMCESISKVCCTVYPECHCTHGYNPPEHTKSSSWTAVSLLQKLGGTDKGSMDPGNCEWLSDRFPLGTNSMSEATPSTVQSEPGNAHTTRSRRTSEERGGDRTITSTRGGFLLHPLPGSKERWGSKTGGQPEGTKQIRVNASLQDGGYSHTEKPPTGGGLASESGSERCLLRHSHTSRAQEVPALLNDGQDIPVHLSSLRPGFGAMGLYQDPKAGCGSRTGAWDASNFLHRRYSLNGGVQTETAGSVSRFDLPVRVPGFHHKPGENSTGTESVTSFPRLHGRHDQDGAQPTTGQNQENQSGSSKIAGGGACLRPLTFTTTGENECDNRSHTPSPAVFSPSTDRPSGSPQGGCTGLRDPTGSLTSQQGRADMVGQSDGELEWEIGVDQGSTRSNHRFGRLEPRLGCVLSACEHRGSMVSTRENQAYQLPGIDRGHTSPKDIREKQDRLVGVVENRQHDSGCVHKQPRGYRVRRARTPDPRPVDVVPREKYTYPCATPPRQLEHCGRQGVEVFTGQIRLEAGCEHLRKNQRDLRPPGGGFVCVQTDTPVPSLFQLAARSLRGGDRCIPSGLVITEGVCQPPLEPSIQCPGEDTDTGSQHHFGRSGVEDATVVSSSASNAGRFSTPSSLSSRRESSSRAPAGRMEHLRKKLRDQQLSVQATELILKSWRSKTNKSYDSLFGRWHRWCTERSSDPFSGPVSEVANFLASLYGAGYQYSSVNAYRSAISSVHDKVDGVDVGQHPIITRLLKGVYNDRPPLPRYTNTWDVQTVLNYIESLGCSEELSLKLLTYKTVFLLAITRPSRSIDLCSLDIKRIQSHSNGVAFLPTSLAKQSRQGKRVESFFFPSFSVNTTLCPVTTLRVYLERTAPLRKEERKLFISFIKPHKAVTSSSIARWLRLILENAGINSSIFGAHSTRGASASAAFRAGITTSDILQAANWSSESVFQKFYHKEVDKAAYGRAVITQNSSKSATNNTVDV